MSNNNQRQSEWGYEPMYPMSALLIFSAVHCNTRDRGIYYVSIYLEWKETQIQQDVVNTKKDACQSNISPKHWPSESTEELLPPLGSEVTRFNLRYRDIE